MDREKGVGQLIEGEGRFNAKADIILGLKILLIYWAIIFVMLAWALVSIGMDSQNEEQETSDSDCFGQCIENKQRVAVISQMLGPGIHIIAFYLIHGGGKGFAKRGWRRMRMGFTITPFASL